jgi:hypothetical protein
MKRLQMHLNFSVMLLTCGTMIVPWNIVSEEGRLLLEGFMMESANSCGYSLTIMSCVLNFLVEILLILTQALARVVKLRATPLFA